MSVLERLEAVIAARDGGDPAQSHTAGLLAKGVGKCAEKFGEEAVETIVAAVQGDRAALAAEAADAVFHLLVVLRAAGVDWADVVRELERREGRSGVAEKASRPS